MELLERYHLPTLLLLAFAFLVGVLLSVAGAPAHAEDTYSVELGYEQNGKLIESVALKKPIS